MRMPSLDHFDHEIDTRRAEFESVAAALVKLEGHGGLEHVRRYPPTGVTAQRWAVVEPAIGRMWEHLRRATTILDCVQASRGSGLGRGGADAAELNRLLYERPLAVWPDGCTEIRSSEAVLSGDVEFEGLADAALGVRSAFPAVVEFLREVDETVGRVAMGVAPHINRLDDLGVPIPREITDLLAVSASDPLSLTDRQVRLRIDEIAAETDRLTETRAEDAALQADWPQAVAATCLQLDHARHAFARCTDARRRAEHAIATADLPVLAVDEHDLRVRLQSLTEPDPAALRTLRTAISDALRDAHANEELALGLLERRTELKGRLKVYEAKAARLGIGEDRDVLASGGIASGLLSDIPCDLAAATRAVAEYQKVITEKRGRR